MARVEPITAALRGLPDADREVLHVSYDGVQTEYCTVAYHRAMVEEIQARWRLSASRAEDEILRAARELLNPEVGQLGAFSLRVQQLMRTDAPGPVGWRDRSASLPTSVVAAGAIGDPGQVVGLTAQALQCGTTNEGGTI